MRIINFQGLKIEVIESKPSDARLTELSELFKKYYARRKKIKKLVALIGDDQAFGGVKRDFKCIIQDSRRFINRIEFKGSPRYKTTYLDAFKGRFSIIERDSLKSLIEEIKQSKQYDRKRLKTFEQTVNTRPGKFLNKLLEKRMAMIFEAKRPQTAEKHVGIEIEFLRPKNISQLDIAKQLFEAGLGSYVELKNDGSVSTNKETLQGGNELTACVPVDRLESVVKKISSILSGMGCEVNKTCGLHVHLDARFWDHKAIFFNLVKAQGVLFAMVPKSRRENTYCKRNTDAEDLNHSRRYKAINGLAYREHGTIEVRLHSGTIDAEKILNWVGVLSSIAYAPKVTQRIAGLPSLGRQVPLSPELRSWIEYRMELFKDGNDSAQLEELAA